MARVQKMSGCMKTRMDLPIVRPGQYRVYEGAVFRSLHYSGCILHFSLQSRDISVRIVNTLRAGRPKSRGFGSRQRQEI